MSENEEYSEFLNETLPVLSEEEDSADATINQSADSLFRPSSGSNLYISNARTSFSPAKRTNLKKTGGQSDRAKFACQICATKLKTEKGLSKHVLSHKLAEVASRRPSPEQLINKCIQDASKVCFDMENTPMSKVIIGNKFSVFADQIQKSANPKPCTKFCEFVEKCVEPLVKPICLSQSISPSSIKKIIRTHLHSCLADSEVRNERLSKLLELVDSELSSEGVPEQYLEEFCRRLVVSTATFVLSLMREDPDDPHVATSSKFSKDDFDSLFSQQTLHNILGSTVKAILRRARQYRGNPKWEDIQKVVLLKFAHIGVMEARPHEKTFWTALLGRKSYTFVSEPVLNFFVEVAKILCYVETRSGSIPIQEVVEKVTSSAVLISQWFDVVGSGLCENDAIFLLRLLVTSLCKTFGRGILLRRSNLEAERRKKSSGGVTSVSKRAQLTR